MTTIVGLVHNGEVWIGADSCSTRGYRRETTRSDFGKMFRVGRLLVATSGRARASQALQHRLTIPHRHPDVSLSRWAVVELSDAIRQTLKDSECATVENGRFKSGVSAIFATDNHLFRLNACGAVCEPDDGLAAEGSGGDYALGAMHATAGLEPEDRIIAALEAAERYDAYTRGPFLVQRWTATGKEADE